MLKRYAAIPFAVMCLSAQMAQAEEVKTLSSVVITATKTEQDSFDLPMSIDKVSKEQIQDGNLRMTLSESLARVPGITAQNRTQMAQDPQISSRGFGARSAFGVRGIRVYVDGIPLSMPDGIGNPGSVDLGMIDSIEVMRGPFSAMYGNSSGGVIQMLTGKAEGPAQVEADVLYGSYKTVRESITASGGNKNFDYQIGLSSFASDGYRIQSINDKRQATIKLGSTISEDSKLTTLINWFDQHAQDPGGFSKTDAIAKPQDATPGAKLANTRVNRNNIQIGFNFENKINQNNTLNLLAYAGTRFNQQYLSTSASAPVTGKVSSIDRDYSGTEIKLTNRGNLMDRPYSVIYGLAAGQMQDKRLDRPFTTISPFTWGATNNRDEVQSATNVDGYAQGSMALSDKLDLHGGLRYTTLTLNITDNLGEPNTGDPLNQKFSKAIPVAGVVYKLTPALNFYGNAGQGFETPTLTEVTYKDPSTPADGPNKTLESSTSNNYEFGIKWFPNDASIVKVAAFNIETSNEIVVDKLVTTTASYTNYKGKTKRIGAELSYEAKLPMGFSTVATYTYLDATFADSYSTTSKTYTAGNRIPGTYKSQAFFELNWGYQPIGFETGINAVYQSDVKADDANLNFASAYSVYNWKASFTQKRTDWSVSEYLAVNNLADTKYIGSIRPNDFNSRFFEPAAGQNWIIGVKAAYKF